MTGPKEMPLPEPVRDIARQLLEAGHDTWCVGGAVRDWLLSLQDDDVDLATAATPEQVQQVFRRTVPVGIKHGTVGVLDRTNMLHEVTTFRKDVATDGRHAVVEYGVTIDEDLARRDFTMNALAYHPVSHELRDPFGGARDIEDRLVRAVGDPATRFAEDYLRILRMVRFAARFGFRIDPATWTAASAAAPRLDGLSAERVREEWFKALLTTQSVSELVRLWREVGAARVWMPELGEVPPGTDQVKWREPIVLTALLCRTPHAVLRRLKASNLEIARAEAMTRGPRRPVGTDPVAIRRWRAAVGAASDDLVHLDLVEQGSESPWTLQVQASRSRGEPVSRGELALTGDDLRADGVPPGPELGRLLERLLDAVIADPSENSRDRLLALARSWR